MYIHTQRCGCGSIYIYQGIHNKACAYQGVYVHAMVYTYIPSGAVAAKAPATSTARDAAYLLVGLFVLPVGHDVQSAPSPPFYLLRPQPYGMSG